MDAAALSAATLALAAVILTAAAFAAAALAAAALDAAGRAASIVALVTALARAARAAEPEASIRFESAFLNAFKSHISYIVYYCITSLCITCGQVLCLVLLRM